MVKLQTCRYLKQHRLVEPINRPTSLQQPSYNWSGRHEAYGNVSRAACARLQRNSNASQPTNSLLLEHRSRRDHQPRLARTAHQLDGADAVAPKRKEIVVNPDPIKAQNLRKQPA